MKCLPSALWYKLKNMKNWFTIADPFIRCEQTIVSRTVLHPDQLLDICNKVLQKMVQRDFEAAFFGAQSHQCEVHSKEAYRADGRVFTLKDSFLKEQ